MISGYSGSPLAGKFGIKQGLIISLYCQPEYYLNLSRDFPNDVKVINGKPTVESLIIS